MFVLPTTEKAHCHNQARNEIQRLIKTYNTMSEGAHLGITEAGVVHQFIDPFFRALGWPVDDHARSSNE